MVWAQNLDSNPEPLTPESLPLLSRAGRQESLRECVQSNREE